MAKRKKYWMVFLPNGTPILTTKSSDVQSATAKAMMMDIPPGCRVEEIKE